MTKSNEHWSSNIPPKEQEQIKKAINAMGLKPVEELPTVKIKPLSDNVMEPIDKDMNNKRLFHDAENSELPKIDELNHFIKLTEASVQKDIEEIKRIQADLFIEKDASKKLEMSEQITIINERLLREQKVIDGYKQDIQDILRSS